MSVRLPTIHTWRLALRPFALSDAAAVQRLAGEKEVAAMVPEIPHPYADGLAEQWISSHPARAAQNLGVVLAVVLRQTEELIGSIELGLNPRHNHGSLGVWVGKPYWNQGFATEAGRAMLRFGFAELGLHRISASHIAGNTACGKVLVKIGMSREGVRRHQVRSGDTYLNEFEYGLIASELPPSAFTAAYHCSYQTALAVAG